MRTATATAVAVIALALAGCGGGDTKTVTRTVTAPPTTSTNDFPSPPPTTDTTPTTSEPRQPLPTETGTTTTDGGGTPAPGSPTQGDAEDAARTAANDYTRDQYGISGRPSDWSATCTGEGDTFSCVVDFNGGQCTGRLNLTGVDLTPGNQKIGCGE